MGAWKTVNGYQVIRKSGCRLSGYQTEDECKQGHKNTRAQEHKSTKAQENKSTRAYMMRVFLIDSTKNSESSTARLIIDY